MPSLKERGYFASIKSILVPISKLDFSFFVTPLLDHLQIVIVQLILFFPFSLFTYWEMIQHFQECKANCGHGTTYTTCQIFLHNFESKQ